MPCYLQPHHAPSLDSRRTPFSRRTVPPARRHVVPFCSLLPSLAIASAVLLGSPEGAGADPMQIAGMAPMTVQQGDATGVVNVLNGSLSLAFPIGPTYPVTVGEAVYAYTQGAAYASGEEHLKGSVSPGKLADLVVISKDIFALDPMDIPQAEVVATVIGGTVAYPS